MGPDTPKEISPEERAKRLKVKKDYENERRIAFTVMDEEKGTIHSVIYHKEKDEWTCDCMWFSTRYDKTKRYCAHILAAKRWSE